MGPDAANLAGSIAKSQEIERSPKATQRASDIAQDQNAEAFISAIRPIRADGADNLRRARLLQERERKRREIEHKLSLKNPESENGSDADSGLDVMV